MDVKTMKTKLLPKQKLMRKNIPFWLKHQKIEFKIPEFTPEKMLPAEKKA